MLANVTTKASGVSRHPKRANVAHSQSGYLSKTNRFRSGNSGAATRRSTFLSVPLVIMGFTISDAAKPLGDPCTCGSRVWSDATEDRHRHYEDDNSRAATDVHPLRRCPDCFAPLSAAAAAASRQAARPNRWPLRRTQPEP